MRLYLVDRIHEIKKWEWIRGCKNISLSEDYFEYHFPVFPIMPGMLILESLVQLSSWLILYSTDFETFGVLSKLNNIKFKHPVQPGDTIEIEVLCQKNLPSEILLQGKVLIEGKIISLSSFAVKIINIETEKQKRFFERHYHFLTTRFSGP